MELFPAFWRLKDRRVVLTGDGEAALNKLRLLARAGAAVALFTPHPSAALLEEAARHGIVPTRRAINANDIGDAAFAVVADDREEDATRNADLLRAERLPVNAVDRPNLCDFSVPAIVDRGAVVVGVATGGASPILAQRIRQSIEAVLPRRLDNLARFAREFRETVSRMITSPAARRRFWERVIDGPIAGDVLEGRDTKAREAMLAALNSTGALETGKGRVIVVGTGSGDAEHLTLKALKALLVADVILHDGNSDSVLDYARRDAERVTVPSALSGARASSEAGAGRVAVLLAPGDGRGLHDRIVALAENNTDIEYVPGIAPARAPLGLIARAV